MKQYPLLFKPSLKKRIWGGSKINEIFGYPGADQNIGEAWVVSDHPEGRSVIINGAFSGESLGVLLEKHPEWFAAAKLDKFPLLVKVLDANDNLSVQVHPDDEYAMKNEKGESGKTECWYVIDSEPGSEIVFGHTAKNKSEFIQMAKENKWDKLLAHVPARAGDFFFIPSGKVHAIGKGILLLEVQQNSDITYRIYDYDRLGLDGVKRALHFEKAIDVIDFQPANGKPENRSFEEKEAAVTTLAASSYFTVEKWLVKGRHDLKLFDVFLLIFIVNGEGELIYDDGSVLLTKGVSIMIPANMGGCRIVGNIEAILSHI